MQVRTNRLRSRDMPSRCCTAVASALAERMISPGRSDRRPRLFGHPPRRRVVSLRVSGQPSADCRATKPVGATDDLPAGLMTGFGIVRRERPKLWLRFTGAWSIQGNSMWFAVRATNTGDTRIAKVELWEHFADQPPRYLGRFALDPFGDGNAAIEVPRPELVEPPAAGSSQPLLKARAGVTAVVGKHRTTAWLADSGFVSVGYDKLTGEVDHSHPRRRSATSHGEQGVLRGLALHPAPGGHQRERCRRAFAGKAHRGLQKPAVPTTSPEGPA